ncbi:hypothetical protein ACFS5N_03975 [Mucilaginibacter ximonensis]|uniref:SH3 domain-containing protein n=1 Tax=Mucilaginibacter ximonensis TaxID=538021 RepID=A0ABW5Y8L4_9SPHI
MVKRIRRYSTSLKVVLVLTGTIAVGYFAKLFTGTKQVVIADTVAESHPLKKHRQKHKFKNHQALTVTAPPVNTAVKAKRGVATSSEPVKQLTPAIKEQPDSVTTTSFLYTTYVQPNITGIVKLRSDDKFYADIIADIPANARVRVLKKGPMYYQVAYNNNIGFVPKWSLQTK